MIMNCFCGIVEWKTLSLISRQDPVLLPEILPITNLKHVTNIIRACAEPEFRVY